MNKEYERVGHAKQPMGEKVENVKKKLKSVGLSDEVVRAVWPSWWSEDAETSTSALNDLKFSVARRLGLAATSLFDEGDATFVWHGAPKFKGLTSRTQLEKSALNAFGSSIGHSLIMGAEEQSENQSGRLADGVEVRASILRSGAAFVELGELVTLSWALGIPVVHLRVLPLNAKRMAAMTVRLGDRYAILLCRDSGYPAPLAFILAHELGHIACGHLEQDGTLVDQNTIGDKQSGASDDEETAADRYALEILTGRAEPVIESNRNARSSTQLAYSVKTASRTERIEPGTLALCYAYETGEWELAQGALKILYQRKRAIWGAINSTARQMLNWENLPRDNAEFLNSVLGFS